jgi:hypothetical protein
LQSSQRNDAARYDNTSLNTDPNHKNKTSMKRTPWRLLLAAFILSSVYLVACSKAGADPSLFADASNHNGRGGNTYLGTNGGTSSGTCYQGQGYWFGRGNHTWPDMNGATAGSITIGTANYTQQQAWDIWKSSNKGGYKDAKKAFVLLTTIQLAGNVSPTYTNFSADVTTLSNWLATLGTLSANNVPSTSMPADVKAAYNRLKDWVEAHSCGGDGEDDDADDEVCTTDLAYWYGSSAHTWPDVNGTAAGNITVAGSTYSATDAAAIWSFYNTSTTDDVQKVWLLLSALQLSGTTPTYSGYTTDLNTLQTWLATFGKLTTTNQPTTAMPANVADAYSRLTTWVKGNDCDGDDDHDDDDD